MSEFPPRSVSLSITPLAIIDLALAISVFLNNPLYRILYEQRLDNFNVQLSQSQVIDS